MSLQELETYRSSALPASVTRVQAGPVSIGARLLLLPASILLWPLVAARWRRSVAR